MAAHRYWRVNMRSIVSTAAQMKVVWLRETPGGANVATGGTPSAESTSYGVAADAFDASTSTYWCSVSGVSHDPTWLAYDFGVGVTKDIVEVYMMGNTSNWGPAIVDLQWSDDGAAWTTSRTWSGLSWASDSTINILGVSLNETVSESLTVGTDSPTYNFTGTGYFNPLVADGFSSVQDLIDTFLRDANYLIPVVADSFTGSEVAAPMQSFNVEVDDLLSSVEALLDGFTSIRHRYWRVYMSGIITPAVQMLWVELRDAPYGAGVSTGGTATAESTTVGTAETPFIGNLVEYWQSATWHDPTWLAYDLGVGNEKNIVQVAMKGGNGSSVGYGPAAVQVQWSDDGATWTTKFAATGLTWGVGTGAYNYVTDSSTPLHYYDQLVADRLTAVELNLLGLGFTLTDIASVVESAQGDVAKLVYEVLQLVEALTVIGNQTVETADSLEVVDLGEAARNILFLVSDILTNSDVFGPVELGALIIETLSGVESVQGQWAGSRVLADLVSVLELASLQPGYGVELDETITTTDTSMALFTLICLASDLATASETITGERQVLPVSNDTITLSSALASGGQFNASLADAFRVLFTVSLGGETYQCWSFTTEDLKASMYSNYGFTSFAVFGKWKLGSKDGAVYVLEGTDDAGAPIHAGVHLNYNTLGTHKKKRLTYAFFGLSGTKPVLKVITDNETVEYYVVAGRAALSRGVESKTWQLVLSDINELDFVEISPIILSR